MKFSTKRRLDYTIGEPLCGLLDIGMRLVAPLARRDHRLFPSFRRVWIIKFVGLGTVVNAMPLLRALRQTYAEAEITFVTFPGMVPLLRRFAEVDRVFILHDTNLLRLAWDCLGLILRAWRTKPELVVDLEAHARFSTVLASLTAAQNRAGFYHSTALFRSRLHTHLMFFNRFAHILDCHKQLGRMLGCEPADEVEGCLSVSSEEQAEAFRYLETVGVNDLNRMVLVNANAGPLCEERRWPRGKFALLIEALVRDYGRTVILTGAPSELSDNEALIALINENLVGKVHNAAGTLSFGASLALIAEAPLLITNDSGPLHFAAALGTPTVSLWGPGAPQSYAPRGRKHRVVFEPIYCSPCLYMTDEPPCNGDNQCMKRLSVQKVLNATLEMLNLRAHEACEIPEATPSASYLPGFVARKGVTLN